MPTPQELRRQQIALNEMMSRGDISRDTYLQAINAMGLGSPSAQARLAQQSDPGQSVGGLAEMMMMALSRGRTPLGRGGAVMRDPGLLGLPNNSMNPSVLASLGLESAGAAANPGRTIAGLLSKLIPATKKGKAALGLGAGGLGLAAYQNANSAGTSTPSYVDPVGDPWGGPGSIGTYPGMGMSADQNAEADYASMVDRVMAMFGAGGGGSGRTQFDMDTDRMQAEAQRLNSETAVASQRADQANKEGELALSRGDRVLARQKFADSQMWSQRAADAQDTQNRIGAYSAETGRQNAETARYGEMTDLFGTSEKAATDRAGIVSRGAENQTSLVSNLGNIANAQGLLQQKMLSTPRNAIASLLMSRGQTPTAGGGYAPGNLMGFDPSMLTNAIQSAMQASQQAMSMPAPQFDLRGVMAGLNGAAKTAQGALPTSMIPQAPTDGRVPSIVGNRIPNYNSPPPATNGWQDQLDRLTRGGAPQFVIDQYRNDAAAAGTGAY